MARGTSKKTPSTELGSEAQPRKMADAFRIYRDAAKSPRVAAGRAAVALLSRAFEAEPSERSAAAAPGAIPVSRPRLVAARILGVPSEAHP